MRSEGAAESKEREMVRMWLILVVKSIPNLA